MQKTVSAVFCDEEMCLIDYALLLFVLTARANPACPALRSQCSARQLCESCCICMLDS